MTAAVAVAGCGGGSAEGGAYGPAKSTAPSRAASSEAGSAVSVAAVGDAGKVLVDSSGLTLYYFEKDRGGKSAERNDGTTQVTYAGWPLDSFGAPWYPLHPNGEKAGE